MTPKLDEYNRIRNFEATPEPAGELEVPPSPDASLRFFVQMHDATGLHYDFRLELDGVLKSFAVPKGPSLNPLDQRLAVHVEDHPIQYGTFEGIIPAGNYGAGTVIVWDVGTYHEKTATTRAESEQKLRAGFGLGHVKFVLEGHKLRGEFALVRLKDKKVANAWMLFKKRDKHAALRDVLQDGVSVLSGRTMKEIEGEAAAKGEVWLSQRLVPEKSAKRANVRKEPAPPPKAAKTPFLIKAMQPVTKDLSPDDLDAPESYLWEAVGAGTRALAFTGRGAKLVSVRGLDLGQKHPEILARLRRFRETKVFDGEIPKDAATPRFVIRDFLWDRDTDLRPLALTERRARLAALGLGDDPMLAIAPVLETRADVTEECTHVLAKNRLSPYREGVSDEWLKLPAGAQATRAPRVVLTSGDKPMWPNAGYVKRHLFDYYAAVAGAMVPHLEGRCLSLHRFPDGIDSEGFFQKDVAGFVPSWFRRERIFSPSSNRSIDYAVCDNDASLLHLANWGTIELNPWLSRVETPDRPTYAAFDLDPDAQEFPQVVEIAMRLRDELDTLGFASFPKTSGATGIHVAVPLGAAFDYDEARAFAEYVMRRVHDYFPKTTTLEAQPAKRHGALYLDFRQNRRGQTLAAPYSARPTPRATVSAPVTWEELEKGFAPEDATIISMPERLARLGDPWAPVLVPPSAETIAAVRKILAQLCVFFVVFLGAGCDWFKKAPPKTPSRPSSSALQQLPTRCYGEKNARGNLVFLHGIMPTGAAPPELDYEKDLTSLAAELSLRIATPKSTFPCKSMRERLCWGTEAPEDIADMYGGIVASAQRCFQPQARFGLVGFSNGGYHATRVVMRCLAPQPAFVISIGSAGDVTLAAKEDLGSCAPLTLLVGDQDGILREAQAFADRLGAEKRARVRFKVYGGGHVMPFAELRGMLKSLMP